MRFEACTDIFFLDVPLDQCLKGAASRIGKEREDMPWIEQEFDPDFQQYILDFQKDQIPRINEGERRMSEIYALILDIMAGIIAHYVCKWFDGE